jgi:hypothetical protein
MNLSSRLPRLLITAVVLGALTQIASRTYDLSTESTEAAMIRRIDFSTPDRRAEAARFALLHAIAEQYGITIADRTAQWQPDEVGSLKSGLDQIADRLSELTGRDGRRVMKGLLDGVAFYRDRAWRGIIAYTIGGTVSFYDVWARYDTTGRTFYLAHELGHVLDARESPLHLLMGEVSQAFARNVDAYSDESAVYHLGRTYPLRDPRDRPRHRTDSAAEDWAESFATVVVPVFEAELRDIGSAREQEVRRFIRLWAAHTFEEQTRRAMQP